MAILDLISYFKNPLKRIKKSNETYNPTVIEMFKIGDLEQKMDKKLNDKERIKILNNLRNKDK